MKDIENDEYVNVIVNHDFVEFNKARFHTLDNNLENDEFVVAIQAENDVNANEENLSKNKLSE